MIGLLRVLLAISLAATVVAQYYVDGNQRIVHVSELISDDGSTLASSGEDLMCCIDGNCSCSSLDLALAHLANNVVINITTNMTLSSLIEVSNLKNIWIIGHNNPTVNCKSVGGMHFINCHNCSIQDIIWDECGNTDIVNHTEPGIKLSNSSNITIHGCTFQNSTGQAVTLLEVSGDVNITHCNFLNNRNYKDHGAAIHYSMSDAENNCSEILFTISNCNFTYNEGAKSLVYVTKNKIINCNNIIFQHSRFSYNRGISIYTVNHNLF